MTADLSDYYIIIAFAHLSRRRRRRRRRQRRRMLGIRVLPAKCTVRRRRRRFPQNFSFRPKSGLELAIITYNAILRTHGHIRFCTEPSKLKPFRIRMDRSLLWPAWWTNLSSTFFPTKFRASLRIISIFRVSIGRRCRRISKFEWLISFSFFSLFLPFFSPVTGRYRAIYSKLKTGH